MSLSESLDTTSAAGRMMFQVIAAFAEFERNLASERTTAAMAHKRTQHERISRFPRYGYGFTEGGTLEPVASELAILEPIRGLRKSGRSWQQIADTLDGYVCARVAFGARRIRAAN